AVGSHVRCNVSWCSIIKTRPNDYWRTVPRRLYLGTKAVAMPQQILNGSNVKSRFRAGAWQNQRWLTPLLSLREIQKPDYFVSPAQKDAKPSNDPTFRHVLILLVRSRGSVPALGVDVDGQRK
ncbi:MAG: hypothetical protein ABI988_09945, partial [Nitrospirota bacterium]